MTDDAHLGVSRPQFAGDHVLDSATACQVVNESLEAIRQAFLRQARVLDLLSPEADKVLTCSLVNALSQNFTEASCGVDPWQIFETAQLLLASALLKSAGDLDGRSIAGLCSRVTVPVESMGGFWFEVPAVPVVNSQEDLTYWIEELHAGCESNTIQFDAAWERSMQFRSVAKLVSGNLGLGIQKRHAAIDNALAAIADNTDTDVEPFGACIWKWGWQIRSCQLLATAIEAVEKAGAEIGRHLLMITLVISDQLAQSVDCRSLESRLNPSAGFRRIGGTLVGLLSQRFRRGSFVISWRELSEAIGAGRNAMVSTLRALVACHVVVTDGWGMAAEVWATPNFMYLATWLEAQRETTLSVQSRGFVKEDTSPSLLENGSGDGTNGVADHRFSPSDHPSLSHHPQPDNNPENPPPKPFEGGVLVFFSDRVELCGVNICSGPRSTRKRRILELLGKARPDGRYWAYSSQQIAEESGLSRGAGAIPGAIRDLRNSIAESLLRHAHIKCRPNDVILSGGAGYRLSQSLTVRYDSTATITDITDTAEPTDVRNGDVQDVFDVRDDEAARRREWIIKQLETGVQLKAPMVVSQFKRSKKTAQRDLDALRDEGKIEFVGDPRTGYYRLVAAR